MSDDYLWNGSGKPDPEVQRLERVLGRLRHERPAPDFSRVAPARAATGRRAVFFGLAAAASLLLAALVWLATRPSEEAWNVARLEGSPRVGSRPLRESGRLSVGEWLETDARSRARIEIGRIGSVEVGPETRLRVIETSPLEHRLDLLHGKIRARTWAPPRLFYVNTPSAVAVDLGCAYTLEVNEAGAGLLRVTSGWVSLELAGRESRVPAGAACETRPGHGPGTPFFEDAPQALRRALAALDFDARDGAAGGKALDAILGAARSRDGLTLWYLLSRAEGDDARRLYDRLATLVRPPAGVTREGVLGGSRPMLSLWWDRLGLEPSPWWKKKLRRLRSTGTRLTQERGGSATQASTTQLRTSSLDRVEQGVDSSKYFVEPPSTQSSDATAQHRPIYGGYLRDIHHTPACKPRFPLAEQDVTERLGEPQIARDHRHHDGRDLARIEGVILHDDARSPVARF